MPTQEELAKMHWRDRWEYDGEEMRQQRLAELREEILAAIGERLS